ncbi:hypothetical protein [Bacillus marinisedimentorum]|nr:hypothetical protein [Bacillus marinisedimentorum]
MKKLLGSGAIILLLLAGFSTNVFADDPPGPVMPTSEHTDL